MAALDDKLGYSVTGVAVGDWPVKGPLPIGEVMTGTATSTGTAVTGTGTLFTTEFRKGDWIYSVGSNQVRALAYAHSNAGTNCAALVLGTSGAHDFSGAIHRIRRPYRYKRVLIKNIGAADGYINGHVIEPGDSVEFKGHTGRGVEPFTYDSTGTLFSIEVEI